MRAAATDAGVACPEARRRLRARLRGLYAVTPDDDDTARLVRVVAAAIDGGASAIQYRHKHAAPPLRLEQAAALAEVCRGRALFVVNDDPALAARVGADGVHVGEDDAAIAIARAATGPDMLIGVSCYDDIERARRAVTEGADYVAFGSFHPSAIKPAARRAGVAQLAAGRALGVPVVAIGGITAANAPPLFAAGASAVAVISAVFADPDPPAVARAARAIAAAVQPTPGR